jgi:2-keto-myo-inositol isomerase
MKPRLCLNTATIKSAPLRLQVELAGAAGFDGVGLWMDDIDAAARGGLPLEEIAALVRSAGLTVEELCFIGKWQECSEAELPAILEETDRLSRACRALGCGLLVAVPAVKRTAAGDAPRRLAAVCAAAAAHGVRVAVEFVGTAEETRDVRSAWRMVEASGSPNAGLLLDTFHFFMGGSRPEDLDRIPAEKVFLVHVSDAVAAPREVLERFHDSRTFPGDGTIDYAPLRDWLDRAGYRGAASLEIWNQDLQRQDPRLTAVRAIQSLRSLFADQGRGTSRKIGTG